MSEFQWTYLDLVIQYLEGEELRLGSGSIFHHQWYQIHARVVGFECFKNSIYFFHLFENLLTLPAAP